MFTEDLFELFSEYESLPETQKPAFLAELKAQYPDKAEQLKLLTQDSNDFTEHFLENISSYSENMAIPSISEGDNFGVYTIVKPIGSGGMGQVYLAKRNDGLIEQQVAIKFLHPALYQLNSTQTLLNEAQALASLNHPNIATVLDVVKMPDGIIYMVMEYIEGCTLTEYLAKNNLSVKEKLNLFLTIADAVQEAHSQRIIHADIKASNILINHKNHPQLIDFGIMQFVGSKEEKSNTFINQYLCAMTVNYAAPEQLQGQPASIHSDVYALGGLLYFILSGQTPFEEVGGTLPDKIKAITEQEIPPCKISQKLKFRQDINWVLSTCLAKQPEQRFRSVEALYLELSYYQNNQPLSTKNSLFYKLVKSWQRHKVTYVLSLSVVILIITFTSKVWYDNIKIKQSYQELTRSYINQYTTLQEITNQSDVIELPSSESIPLNLYIKLAFQKYDLEVGSSAVNGLQTMNQLKLLLLENKFSDDKTLHLVEYRAFLVKNKVINSDEMIKAFRRSFNDILVRNDLTPEERINIIFVTMNLGKLHYVKIKLKKELEQLDKTLIVEALSPSESIKYNLIKAFYFSDIATNISINPTNFSQKALAIAEKHSDEIPSELYLVTLYLNVKTIEKYQGFSIDYFKMVQKPHIYLSKVNFSVDNNGVMNLYSRINQTLLFDQFKSFPFTNIENSKLKEDKTSSIREAQYLFITGQYEQSTEAFEIIKNQVVEENGVKGFEMINLESNIIELNLKKGVIGESLLLINETLLPHYIKYESDNSKASAMLKFCVPLSYHLAKEELDKFCKQPYLLTKSALGEKNFWTDYTLTQLVWWYGLNSYSEGEKTHVKRLENILPNSSHHLKIQQLESLIYYFINRNNVVKANIYLELLDTTIKDYAGNSYIVHIDRSKIFRAEVKVLESHKESAVALLKEVSNTVCQYAPKNYLRMHLNQVADNVGIIDICF